MVPFLVSFLAALLALPTFAALLMAALHFGLIKIEHTTVIADERDPARPSDPAPAPTCSEPSAECPVPGCDRPCRQLDASTTTIGTRPTTPEPESLPIGVGGIRSVSVPHQATPEALDRCAVELVRHASWMRRTGAKGGR